MNKPRTLTKAQHRKLDKVAEEFPFAIVVGWSEKYQGPKISRAGGRITIDRRGTRRILDKEEI